MLRIGAFVLGLALASAAAAQAPAPERITLSVEGGTLSGVITERANIFRNIPFAAAPVGKLRWAPPQPAARWQGARDATKNGPSCPQPMTANDTPNSGGANGPISEDCLQLNVFAPKPAANPSRRAPVIVWLHGGSNILGAGWIYDGQNFARDGVLFVGWGPDDEASANRYRESGSPWKNSGRASFTNGQSTRRGSG